MFDYIFRLIYVLMNHASLSDMRFSDRTSLGRLGFEKLIIDEENINKLNEILAKFLSRAQLMIKMDMTGAHDISQVGNMPFSLESLATLDEIQELNLITREIINKNDVIEQYLGCKLEKLNIELTLLANIKGDNIKKGSQFFHRDIYHSFYRGLKIFYPFNYDENHENGGFRFLPLSEISSSHRPSLNNKFRTESKKYRFDRHPAVTAREGRAVLLKTKECIAIDTYNCFHAGGYINSDNFIRLIFQIVISPKWTPNKFKDITSSHFSRFLYFNLLKIRNFFRLRLKK
jgi:hypothetical protein